MVKPVASRGDPEGRQRPDRRSGEAGGGHGSALGRRPTEGAVRGLSRELLRKRVHLATVIVPAIVWFLPRTPAIVLLSTGVAVALAIEWGRRKHPWARYQFLRRTRRMLRAHERHGLAGATHMAIAYLLALMLLPRSLAVLAMLYNALGDSAAAIVGRRWGRHRVPWGKSWEGAIAALAVNLAVGLALPGITLPAAVLGGVASAALEFLPLPLDDNLRITIGGGFAAWLGMSVG